MSALIAASAIKTCFGDIDATFDALMEGRSGIAELGGFDRPKLNVARAYPIVDTGEPALFRASAWLAQCISEALRRAGVDLRKQRACAIVGTGLCELRAVELLVEDTPLWPAHRLHFGSVVRAAAPGIGQVITISNACSAAGHCLALAQDMLELGDHDVVIVGAADSMTESMLAMIGRVVDAPTDALRPFDVDRKGVLLGEGAAALVLVAEGKCSNPQARVLSTGMSCDARHPTAPDPQGIRRAMCDALTRAERRAAEVDMVIAHGTGTPLNDPIEADSIAEVLGRGQLSPLVTAIKGAIGHTSGASSLISVAIALRCLARGVVPPIVGLRRPLQQAEDLRLVMGEPRSAALRLAQVNAFGFGGVNAITLLEAGS